LKLATLGLAALAAMSCASAASAQTVPSADAPTRRVTDGRGVDLTGGDFHIGIPLVSFGAGTSLSASFDLSVLHAGRTSTDFANTAGWMMGEALQPRAQVEPVVVTPVYDYTFDYENVVFPTGTGFTQQATIYHRNEDGSATFHTNADGSKYTQSYGPSHFTRLISTDPNLAGVYDSMGDKGVPGPTLSNSFGYNQLVLQDKFVFADGEEWRFYRQYVTVPCIYTFICHTTTIARVRFIASSRGYGIQFLYASDSTPASDATAGAWYGPRQVTGYNKASVYCDESALAECPAVSALPSATIVYNSAAGTVTVTSPGTSGATELTLYHGPGSNWFGIGSKRQTAVPNSTESYGTATAQSDGPFVSSITDSRGTWSYTRTVYADDSGHVPLMSATSTNPIGGQVQILGYSQFGQVQTYTDELNRTYQSGTGFPYRDGGTEFPEENGTYVGRDDRNNITLIYDQPKPNSGQATRTTYSASYPVDCINPKTCNRPIWVRDGNNNQTDFTYAPEHGGVLTETGPAVNGVRPQKRYTYQQRYAWISNGAGGYVHASSPIWLLTQMAFCKAGNPAASGTGCANGSSDEVITTYDYGPDSGPNNLLLRGTLVDSGGLNLRACYAYDSRGNKVSETSPRAGLASCP
jgi:hypothetical protein